MAWRTRNSVRRRGTKTPGSTAIRRPQKSAQPTTCSRGRPDARRSTIAVSSAAVPAAAMSSSVSSSANTHPADRSLVTMADREPAESCRDMGAQSQPRPVGRRANLPRQRAPGAARGMHLHPARDRDRPDLDQR